MTFFTIQQLVSGVLFFIAFILWYRTKKDLYKNPFLIGLVIALGFPFIILAFSFLPDPNSIRLSLQKLVFTGLTIILGISTYSYYKKLERTTINKDMEISIEDIKIPKHPEVKSKPLDLNQMEREIKRKEKVLERKIEKIENRFKKSSEKEDILKEKEKELRILKDSLEDQKMDLENDKEDLKNLIKKKEHELSKIEKRKIKLLKLEKELNGQLKKFK